MDCPMCGEPMEAGAFAIQGSVMRFLAAGLSWDSLWFRRDGESRKQRELVLDIGDDRLGWRCPACRASLVRG